MQKEIRNHYIPKISLKDSIMLFFSTWFGKCLGGFGCPIDIFCCNMCFPKRKKLEKLYDATIDRFDEETNIVKIMKNLRDMKTLQENSVMDESMKFSIAHHMKNYIDLDTTQSEEESSLSDVGETNKTLIDQGIKASSNPTVI